MENKNVWHNVEQGSDDWFNLRLAQVTASKISDIMAKTKSGYSTSRANYMAELLNERLTGQRKEGFTNANMERGTTLEPIARSAYEVFTGYTVETIGFIQYDGLAFGGSPDGVIERDAEGNANSIEIKCPLADNHWVTILANEIPSQYRYQLLGQLALTGGKWVDFVSFNNELPEALQIKVIRFNRDELAIADMLREIRLFLTELDELENKALELISDGINNDYLKFIQRELF